MKNSSVFSKDGVFKIITHSHSSIEDWFDSKFKEFQSPPCVSVDVRCSNFKIAPVDINVFPAGFNNLNDNSVQLAAKHLRSSISAHCKVLIVPENHTRNTKYIDSLIALKSIFEIAGAQVRVAHFEFETSILTSFEKRKLEVYSMKRVCNHLILSDGFIPDVVLLNNDMTSNCMETLHGVEHEIMPDLRMGWFNRSKGSCFKVYSEVAEEFAREFSLDSFLYSPITIESNDIDFSDVNKLKKLASKVDKLLFAIDDAYKSREIKEKPYVFLKASNGTDGMGVMTATCGEDILNINKKNRNKMKVIKGKTVVTNVIIQEGIVTTDKVDGYSAESLLYAINSDVCSYLLRYHGDRNTSQSLNTVGANFLDESESLTNFQRGILRFVGRLSCLTVAIESYKMKNTNAKA